jgi:hypothetical protein
MMGYSSTLHHGKALALALFGTLGFGCKFGIPLSGSRSRGVGQESRGIITTWRYQSDTENRLRVIGTNSTGSMLQAHSILAFIAIQVGSSE